MFWESIWTANPAGAESQSSCGWAAGTERLHYLVVGDDLTDHEFVSLGDSRVEKKTILALCLDLLGHGIHQHAPTLQ